MGGPDKYLVMVSMKSVRDRAGVRKFAERFPLAFKSDRVSLHGLIQELTHERNDRAGIKASAQEGSKGDVTDEVHLHALAQQGFQSFGVFFFSNIAIMTIGKRQVPITAYFPTTRVALEDASGRERINVLKHRLRRWNIFER